MKAYYKYFVALAALAAGLVAGAGPLDGINPAWSTKGGVTDAIEAPNSVVGDFSAFTARITLNVTSQPAAGSSVVLFDQWTSDTGWKLAPRPIAQRSKLVQMGFNIPAQRLPRNASTLCQFCSRHCLHRKFVLFVQFVFVKKSV